MSRLIYTPLSPSINHQKQYKYSQYYTILNSKIKDRLYLIIQLFRNMYNIDDIDDQKNSKDPYYSIFPHSNTLILSTSDIISMISTADPYKNNKKQYSLQPLYYNFTQLMHFYNINEIYLSNVIDHRFYLQLSKVLVNMDDVSLLILKLRLIYLHYHLFNRFY